MLLFDMPALEFLRILSLNKFVISFFILVGKPGVVLVPPEIKMDLYNPARQSISHYLIM